VSEEMPPGQAPSLLLSPLYADDDEDSGSEPQSIHPNIGIQKSMAPCLFPVLGSFNTLFSEPVLILYAKLQLSTKPWDHCGLSCTIVFHPK
jgi:hypothetical protein